MSTTLMVVIGAIILFVGYVFYGKYLAEKVFVLDPKAKTPAETLYDRWTMFPPAPVLLRAPLRRHIAGAAGPDGAYLLLRPSVSCRYFFWIVIGSVFFGGVHDFSALIASARHDEIHRRSGPRPYWREDSSFSSAFLT